MQIKIDNRENELIEKIKNLVLFIPSFKQLKISVENLPLGDVIISDNIEDKLIIERKTINDLLASIKDGRYEEQSYRLNGINHHNHNIIYLIEGDINRYNKFKTDNNLERLTTYSAMFSLNYFKGFSVMRSFNIEETAIMICNIAYKLNKETNSGKIAYYPNIKQNIKTKQFIKNEENNQDPSCNNITTNNVKVEEHIIIETQEEVIEEPTEKDYISVIKKVKKENITPDNIGEIMLCQIPGISSVTALAIIEKYGSIPELIKQIDADNNCMKDISYTNSKGQTRKINKTSIANIVKYLMKK